MTSHPSTDIESAFTCVVSPSARVLLRDDTVTRLRQEADRAAARYGGFTSTHEGLGVLGEELHELIDAIRSNDLAAIGREALQVAAVAARLAQQCADGDDAFARRSGVRS